MAFSAVGTPFTPSPEMKMYTQLFSTTFTIRHHITSISKVKILPMVMPICIRIISMNNINHRCITPNA
jgi:hypothetical protein